MQLHRRGCLTVDVYRFTIPRHPKSEGENAMRTGITRHHLVASDFDQTLSLNDWGIVLSELIGVAGVQDKGTGLSDIHLVQQGAELAYLLRHDPELRCVRRAHLVAAGKHVHLKKDIARLLELLADGIDGHRFSFRLICAAPPEIALEAIVPPEHISRTEFDYDPPSDDICGKVVVLGELEAQLQVSPDRIVYVGDGSRPVVRGGFDLLMRVAALRSHSLTGAIESMPSGLHHPRHKEHHDIL
jgi:hypothetical protein